VTWLTWDHDAADFYAAAHETSTAETVDKLLEEKLEGLEESEVGPLTVVAWRHAKVDAEASARRMAERAIEALVEEAQDEWGGDDWEPPDTTALEEAFREALVPWLSEVTPWCDEVGRRTFTRDELLAWGRARGWWGGAP
jgi:hypothetical protein